MNSCVIKTGFFRRKVEFTFDLAALKAATAACRRDIGEFYTSKEVSEDARFFFHSYGAWLKGENHSPELLRKYAKQYEKFTAKQLNTIKAARTASEIMSAEMNKFASMKSEKSGQKKNY